MMTLGPYELNTIVTGDARELAEAIPAESVDLIFTDPVYDRIEDYEWLAQTAARVLKPDSWFLVFYDTKVLPEVTRAIDNILVYVWQHICYMPTINAWGADYTFITYRGLLRYKKGSPRPVGAMKDLIIDKFDPINNGHKWTKNKAVVSKLIQSLTNSNAVIFDPFTGGGTVPAVCKMLGRNYLAFEIDPATADKARQRVLMTQPPLFVAQPEQVPMFA